MRTASLLAGTIIASALAFPAFAADEMAVAPEEETYPYIEGELELQLGNDWFFRSDDPDNELNDLFLESTLGLAVHFNPYLTLNVGLTLEPVDDPRPGKDRYFGDLGLYMDTLNLETTLGGLTLTAGKFGPGFGTAWDITPGIYGTDLAEDYELSEMLGFGVANTFEETAFGNVTLGANLFTADTTFLSDSAFTSRGRLARADGGATNTGRLDNFSFTIDGEEIAALPGFSWHLGYRHLEPGIGDVKAENGFVAGVAQTFSLENEVELTVNGELVYLSNAFAGPDDMLYATAGLGIVRGPWHGELAGTLRKTKFDGGGSQNDYVLQAAAGYEWENGVDLSLGYGYGRDGGVGTHAIGVRLTKTFEFSSR
jgi:opacity protein-like surface antigen